MDKRRAVIDLPDQFIILFREEHGNEIHLKLLVPEQFIEEVKANAHGPV